MHLHESLIFVMHRYVENVNYVPFKILAYIITLCSVKTDLNVPDTPFNTQAYIPKFCIAQIH